jgi:hypothetical protein
VLRSAKEKGETVIRLETGPTSGARPDGIYPLQ